MGLRIGASLGLDYKNVVLFAKIYYPFDSNAKKRICHASEYMMESIRKNVLFV